MTSCSHVITAEAGYHAIVLVCRVLKVSRSASGAWREQPRSARAQADQRLAERIRLVHQTSRGIDGSRRRRAPLGSRRVVGWAMADHLRTELVLQALDLALQSRRPPPGLIHHPDRGCQDTALAFGQRLAAAGLLASLGAVGTWYDTAVAESFFATLTGELLHRQDWPTPAAAERAIFSYVVGWDNRQRRHSTLGYATTVEFERLAQEVAVAYHRAVCTNG